MAYYDVVIIAVPEDQKGNYLDFATRLWDYFKSQGALEQRDLWGQTIPRGKNTDFFRAVQAKDNEMIVCSMIKWPDKATRDKSFEKMSEMRDSFPQLPFDGSRLIMGGFEELFNSGKNPHE